MDRCMSETSITGTKGNIGDEMNYAQQCMLICRSLDVSILQISMNCKKDIYSGMLMCRSVKISRTNTLYLGDI